MIKSFLIITRDGVPLFVKSPDKFTDNTLISCFLSAIQSFAQEIEKGCIDTIAMETTTFHYAVKGNIFSIAVSDSTDEVDSRIYKITAERLSRAFLEKYNENTVEKNKETSDFFNDFSKEYEQITTEIESLQKQSNKDFILDYFSKAASDENIVGMIVFDLKKDEIIASDIPLDISETDFESFSSMLFSFIDRLGAQLNQGKINEILMRGKQHWIGGFRKGDLAVFTIFAHDFLGSIIPEFISSAIE